MRASFFVFFFVFFLALSGLFSFALQHPTGRVAEPWWARRSYTANLPEQQAFQCRCVTAMDEGYCVAANCYSDDVAQAFCNRAMSAKLFCRDCTPMGVNAYIPKNVNILATTRCTW